MASPTRPPLRGGCHCGRNRYIVDVPADAADVARVLFETHPAHRASLASPIPAFLRIPLAWYHSTTRPFFPDETSAMIHRVYESPSISDVPAASTTQRHFCGFCGTPLSFWSETPRSEAAFIRLALGSLLADDLGELDEWVADEDPDAEADDAEPSTEAEQEHGAALAAAPQASPTGLPWLDSYVEGSRLGRRLQQQEQRRQRQRQASLHQQQVQVAQTPNVTRSAGLAQSADGTVQVEWEVVEWTEGDDGDEAGDGGDGHPADKETDETGPTLAGRPSPAKRPKHSEPDDGE